MCRPARTAPRVREERTHPCGIAKSVGYVAASWPAAVISATNASSACTMRAAPTTFAPRSAKASAAVRPIPLDAPITTTTCSGSGFGIRAPLTRGSPGSGGTPRHGANRAARAGAENARAATQPGVTRRNRGVDRVGHRELAWGGARTWISALLRAPPPSGCAQQHDFHPFEEERHRQHVGPPADSATSAQRPQSEFRTSFTPAAGHRSHPRSWGGTMGMAQLVVAAVAGRGAARRVSLPSTTGSPAAGGITHVQWSLADGDASLAPRSRRPVTARRTAFPSVTTGQAGAPSH
jgi:hypothetical protein